MFNAPWKSNDLTAAVISENSQQRNDAMSPHGFKGVWCQMSARAFCPPPLTVTVNRSVVWKSSNYLRGRSEVLSSSTCAAGKPAVCRLKVMWSFSNKHSCQRAHLSGFCKDGFFFCCFCFTEMSWKENDVTKNKCKKLHWLKTGWGVKWSVNEVCASVHLVFSWWLSENLHLMSDVQSRTFQEQPEES